MTAYLTSFQSSQTWESGTLPLASMAIRAVSFEVRIARIELTRTDGENEQYPDQVTTLFDRYNSGTISGGSALPITPLRQGAPAATATARGSSNGVTVSGTSVPLGGLPAMSSGSTSYEFAFDMTLSPGAVLFISLPSFFQGPGSNISCSLTVSFEELRLSWPY